MTADPLDSGAVKLHLGGECYNRKTLNRVKKSTAPKQQVSEPRPVMKLLDFSFPPLTPVYPIRCTVANPGLEQLCLGAVEAE